MIFTRKIIVFCVLRHLPKKETNVHLGAANTTDSNIMYLRTVFPLVLFVV